MKASRLFAPMLAVALATSAAAFAQYQPQQPNYPPPPQQQGYPQQQPGYQQPGYPQQGDRDHDRDRDRDWANPPNDLRNDMQRQGFGDGINAARDDYRDQRQMNAGARNEYRHPPVSKYARTDYRFGFRRGYNTAMRHMMERHDDHDRDRDRDRPYNDQQPH